MNHCCIDTRPSLGIKRLLIVQSCKMHSAQTAGHRTLTHGGSLCHGLRCVRTADSGATSSVGKAAASPSSSPAPPSSSPAPPPAPRRKPGAGPKPGASGGSAGSQDPQQPKRRGRPPGSKSKPKAPKAVPVEDDVDD